MLRTFSARGWARAKGPDARPGNLAIGVALGSGYQNWFAALSPSARQSEIASMRAAGISWVRMDAEWWTVEPSQGVFDWSNPDVTADAMLAGGMNLVVLLNESPVWARRAAGTAPLNSPWPTPDPQLYAEYCGQAAAHYAAKGVHVFELWNEPNLDTGANTAAGWGYQSPWGFADLAVAAYPAIKAADPKALVLGGTLATATEFGTAGTARTASWAAVPAGAVSATVSCPTATAADAYGILTGTADGWPVGTVITSAAAGLGYTVVPPAWLGAFPAVPAATGHTVRTGNVQYPPDVFLTQAYARAAGRPMWDALAIHPYTQPLLPAAQAAVWGGWATVPALRQIMKDNGEGAKPMWITEVGAPTGAATVSWPAAAATAGTLAVSGPSAAAADLGYQLAAPGLPAGSYVGAVSPGSGWTVLPPVGTLAAGLAKGTPATSLQLAATSTALTIPAGTVLTVQAVPAPLTVTTSAAVTTATAAATTVPVTGFTPAHSYAAGSVVQGPAGQLWGSAVAAATGRSATLTPPGVATAYGQVDEPTQAAIISQVFRSITVGVPAGSGSLGSDPWPFVGPVFLFCWSDAGGTAGPFGLVRQDGTPKAALAALTALARTGGV
ncbi:hypothetical protein GCM10009760_45900 [Kitasatospora kazusensis]|uniref:Glycoside hydrolase family 5 domain-containing protein n=1 Tax=Kitasatospora kazusensis TaxID=407974 RepID=A0ABN3A0F0_9ACTN